jgi:hypothetical protein
MDKKNELIVDVKLEPGDVYHPFLWSRQNIIRWVLLIASCVILYEMSPSWPLDFPFPEKNNGLLLLYLLVAAVLLASFLVPYLRVRSTFRNSPAYEGPGAWLSAPRAFNSTRRTLEESTSGLSS